MNDVTRHSVLQPNKDTQVLKAFLAVSTTGSILTKTGRPYTNIDLSMLGTMVAGLERSVLVSTSARATER